MSGSAERMQDTADAFVPGQRVHIEGHLDGPLAGLTFAAKDLFDVAGTVTGGGSPGWARGRAPAGCHAALVQRLLDAGATLVGKTITDEVSLGILGENAFFGTPRNSKAPDSVPGGSSSGSAAAVAAGLCDTALGTDTGGSMRVPASFCGLYGIRPTHGRLDLAGMVAQMPEADTAGWFARDAATFARVSEAIFAEPAPRELPKRLLVAVDALGFADPETAAALEPLVQRLEKLLGKREEVALAPQGLSAWARAMRTLQPWQAWLTFKDWVDREDPPFAFSVARYLVAGSQISPAEHQWAALMRQEARARVAHLLRPGTVLCMPTTPFPAIRKGLALSAQQDPRDRITCLTAQGGLTGVPQVSMPGAVVDGRPVGLSILGSRGGDMTLVALAAAFERST